MRLRPDRSRGPTIIDWLVGKLQQLWSWVRKHWLAARESVPQEVTDPPVLASAVKVCMDCGCLVSRGFLSEHKNACRELRRPSPRQPKKPPRGYL